MSVQNNRIKTKLRSRWIKKLATLPETGMGYQVVNIYLKNGDIQKEVLVVSPYIFLPRGVNQKDFIDIRLSEK